MDKWKCTVCGYIHQGEEPPQRCPVCGADRAKFNRMEEQAADVAEEKATQMKAGPALKWKCTVCGYIHTGPEPPEVCPVCGAPKSKFILLKEEAVPVEGAAETTRTEGAASVEPSKTQQLLEKIKPVQDFIVTFHGHPIAVHIPNGVLPLTVLFAFLSAMFGSESLSAAARWNTIFIWLSMPVVIFTGLSDWQRRFDMRISKVFKIKMVCAGIVFVLTTILAIWWIVQPDILIDENSSHGLFLFLNVVDLVAAAVAGWYGGKLVFTNNT